MIEHNDYRWFLTDLKVGSVDLVLTDPPYAISRETRFGFGGLDKFNRNMIFGEWDLSEIDLTELCNLSYRVLKESGTLIVFYDLWKIENLKLKMEEAGFNTIRLIIWEKPNPVPVNSKVSYLTNSREVAVLAVKGGNPTFNTKSHRGVFTYPSTRKDKIHPTQKPLKLIEDIMLIHSNKGDYVIDPFAGSGTTAIAAIKHERVFNGCDLSEQYVEKARKRIQDYKDLPKQSRFV